MNRLNSLNRINRLNGPPKQGGVSWSSYWATRNAYFALPATGVSLMVGQEVTIYGDTLINVPIDNPLVVTYTCDIGTQVGNNLVITPEAGDIGNHNLRAVFKNGSYTIEDKTIALTVYGEAPTGTKGILMVGDSLMVGGCTYYAAQIDAALSECTITYIGVEGTTVKHEGHSGADFNWFISNAASPFVKTGALDIDAYFTDNSIADPDYVYIMLGINDRFSHCAIAGNKLTDAEITAILDNAKTLIDAFIAHNAATKIILGLPTITSDTVDGWNANYDESIYSQDYFIENIHKYRLALVEEFAAGTYHANVDCGYESIFLDRDDGYPKTDGVHTNAVHPDQSGYEQLGIGIALDVNKVLAADLMPTGLTVVWEEDHAKIDFTDASAGAAQHEIWSSKNGADYVLVTTLDAATVTYNDATWQNASMNYRVRAKGTAWYSDYTEVVNIVTPLVFKTDQTTLNNLVISTMSIAAGKSVNIAWGDGTDNDYTGVNSNITKAYGEGNEANPYYVAMSGDVNSITYLQMGANVKTYGDLSKWCLPTGLTTKLTLFQCAFTGDISEWVLPSGLLELNITENTAVATAGFTGDISGWTIPASMDLLQLAHDGSGLKLEGNLSGWTLPASCRRVYINNQDFTGLPRGAFVGIDAVLGIYAPGNNCSIAEVDAFLVAVNDYFTSVTPTKNAIYRINGVGMGIPSATGLAAKAAIEAKYTAAGFTATITVNS